MNAPRKYAAGEVCRADLRTGDVAAARSFYMEVLGWHFEDLPGPDGRSCWKVLPDNGALTVIAPQHPHQEAPGTPAQWTVCFAADDAQAIAGEAPHLGGELQSGPEAAPGSGVMVMLAVPGGGTTGVWQAGTNSGAAPGNGPGALAWAELLTPEPQAAVAFFQQLFGHEVTEYPQEDGGMYTTLMANGAEVAGIAPLAAAEEDAGTGRAQWQVYFGVSDVAATVAAAVAAGAVVLVEPEDLPGEGTEDGEESGIVATLQDPQGAVFSLVQA